MSKVISGIVGAVLIVLDIAFFHTGYLSEIGWSLIIGNALAIVSQALVGKPRLRRMGQDIEYQGTVEPRRIIYGTMRVSGMQVIPPWTSGATGINLHQVLAVAGHQCEELGDIYFNKDVITSAQIGAVIGNSTDGLVNAGTYANVAWIRRYVGNTSQSVDFILNAAVPEWTSSHRGKGVAYIALTYKLDETIYKSGKPDIRCLVKGKKVYDPRLDSSPGANPTNAAYIAFSANPALCTADYLFSSIGLAEVATRIDWDLVVAAANECDELVVIPPSASPSHFQKRYTCNTVLEVSTTDEERRANLEVLVQSMMGHVVYRGGKWRMYAGATSSSTFALTESDLVGKFSIRTEMPSNEKYNQVRGQFVDIAREYQLSEFEPRFSSAYETEDGGRFPREVIFTACVTQYEAQRNALIVLKRSRRKKRVTGTWGMSAFAIRPWDVGTMTIAELGWNAQSVRCLAWQFKPNGTIEATFLEELASDWNDPVIADYSVPGTGTGPAPGFYTPDPPMNVRTTGLQNAILIQWDKPTIVLNGAGFELRESTSSTMTSPTTRYVGNDIQVIVQKIVATTFYYQARTSFNGVFSAWEPPSVGVSGAVSNLVGVLNAGVSPGTATASGGTASLTTGNVTVTASAGTPGYTYAWTWFSGGASITINSPTAATTSFTATGLTAGESRTGQARCTVKDSKSPQAVATVDVSVTITRDAATINIYPALAVEGFATNPTDAYAKFQIDADGHVYTGVTSGAPTTDVGLWCTPVDYAANYEVMVSRTGGSQSDFTTGPALDTWFVTTSDRLWVLTQTGFGAIDIVFTIKFRKNSASSPQAIVATITLNQLIADSSF